MNLWMYWEDKPGTVRPAYIDLCIESVFRVCGEDFDVKLLDRNTLEDYIDLHGNFDRITRIAHKADYLRYKLLRDYGGIWLDCDMAMINSLDSVKDIVREHKLAARGTRKVVSINFLAAVPGHIVFKECVREVEALLDDRQDFKWRTIGSDLFTGKAVRNGCYLYDNRLFAPISFRDCRRFSETGDIDLTDVYCVALSNMALQRSGDKLCGMSREEILKSDSLIGKIFRKGL